MKKPTDLMGSIHQTHSQSNSDRPLLEVEKELVRRFFGMVRKLYGEARCRATWPSDEELKTAMQVWGRDIIKFSHGELMQKILFAKSMMHQPDWKFPDIAMILRGNQQPGASGIAAASYKPAAEVLNALPPPPQDKGRGQAMLDALKAELDASTEAEKKTARDEVNAMRAELAELEAKHVPYGKYLRRTANGDYVPTDIAHPMRSLASEGREFCFMDQAPTLPSV